MKFPSLFTLSVLVHKNYVVNFSNFDKITFVDDVLLVLPKRVVPFRFLHICWPVSVQVLLVAGALSGCCEIVILFSRTSCRFVIRMLWDSYTAFSESLVLKTIFVVLKILISIIFFLKILLIKLESLSVAQRKRFVMISIVISWPGGAEGWGCI